MQQQTKSVFITIIDDHKERVFKLEYQISKTKHNSSRCMIYENNVKLKDILLPVSWYTKSVKNTSENITFPILELVLADSITIKLILKKIVLDEKYAPHYYLNKLTSTVSSENGIICWENDVRFLKDSLDKLS